MDAALKRYDAVKGINSGLYRNQLWRAPVPGGRDALVDDLAAPALAAGNQENAEVIAAAAVKKVRSPIQCFTVTVKPTLLDKIQAKRKEIFTEVSMLDENLKLVIDANSICSGRCESMTTASFSFETPFKLYVVSLLRSSNGCRLTRRIIKLWLYTQILAERTRGTTQRLAPQHSRPFLHRCKGL